MWAVLRRTIAPAASASQNVNDAADDPAIIDAFDAACVRRQVGFNSQPLFIAQPKQIAAHATDLLRKANQIGIVLR
jgi:hypothetical protein